MKLNKYVGNVKMDVLIAITVSNAFNVQKVTLLAAIINNASNVKAHVNLVYPHQHAKHALIIYFYLRNNV